MELVCPHCHRVNRVPEERLSQDPKCGACHAPLFTGHPISLDEASFKRYLEREDLPLVVDFWAPWCGPCKMMAPAFEQAARQFEPSARFAKVNTDEHPQAAAPYGIRGIPTLILFKSGREYQRVSGAMNFSQLSAWLRQYL